MRNVCKHRLHGPTRHDQRDISELEIGFVVAGRRGQGAIVDLVLVERPQAVLKARINEGCAEFIIRPVRHQPIKHDATIDISIKQIAV